MNKPNATLQGIGFIVLSMLILSFQSIIVKWISGDYSIMQIVTIRSTIALPLSILLYRMEGQRGLPKTQQPKLEYLRGGFLFLAFTTTFMGLAALPLADIAAIRYSGPLVITLLSVILLGEKISAQRLAVLGLGFCGVLFIVRPGSVSFNLGSIFILLSVLFYSINVILTRKLKTTDSSAAMAYFSTWVYLAAAIVLSPLALLVGEMPNAHPSIAFLFRSWSVPTLLDLGFIFALALIWAGGMYANARAYSAAQASVIAPFEYISLPINVLWGFLFWYEIPTVMTLIGASLTLLSSLYILNREQKLQPA
jgi:drug/metabolite transporter (DMT)-like permease